MDMSQTTTNSFAKLLVFYDAVKRSKLNSTDLLKIVNKYKNKPDAMMHDLQKKYADLYSFPSSVLLADVLRLQHKHVVPPCLLELLPQVDALPRYDERLDIRAAGFDAVHALRSDIAGQLLPCAPLPGAPAMRTLDNLSKAGALLPGASSVGGSGSASSKTTRVDTESNTGRDSGGEKIRPDRVKEVVVRPLDRIALASSKHKVPRESHEVTAEREGDHESAGQRGGSRNLFSLEDSPLALLFSAMQKRRRVRVLIRHVNSIRGTVDGFVRGFDKHFNLLLTDVDESYSSSVPASIAGPASATRPRPRPRHNMPGVGSSGLHFRHLPQLLVRGDNVVLVCFHDSKAGGRHHAETSK